MDKVAVDSILRGIRNDALSGDDVAKYLSNSPLFNDYDAFKSVAAKVSRSELLIMSLGYQQSTKGILGFEKRKNRGFSIPQFKKAELDSNWDIKLKLTNDSEAKVFAAMMRSFRDEEDKQDIFKVSHQGREVTLEFQCPVFDLVKKIRASGVAEEVRKNQAKRNDKTAKTVMAAVSNFGGFFPITSAITGAVGAILYPIHSLWTKTRLPGSGLLGIATKACFDVSAAGLQRGTIYGDSEPCKQLVKKLQHSSKDVEKREVKSSQSKIGFFKNIGGAASICLGSAFGAIGSGANLASDGLNTVSDKVIKKAKELKDKAPFANIFPYSAAYALGFLVKGLSLPGKFLGVVGGSVGNLFLNDAQTSSNEKLVSAAAKVEKVFNSARFGDGKDGDSYGNVSIPKEASLQDREEVSSIELGREKKSNVITDRHPGAGYMDQKNFTHPTNGNKKDLHFLPRVTAAILCPSSTVIKPKASSIGNGVNQRV